MLDAYKKFDKDLTEENIEHTLACCDASRWARSSRLDYKVLHSLSEKRVFIC